MKYTIEILPKALKDLKVFPKKGSQNIIAAINRLEDDLFGDTKRLTNHTPEYRLRVGNFRVLFEIEGTRVIIYRILDRKDAYRFGG
jgi:mRNA interferase RelE/StbE